MQTDETPKLIKFGELTCALLLFVVIIVCIFAFLSLANKNLKPPFGVGETVSRCDLPVKWESGSKGLRGSQREAK